MIVVAGGTGRLGSRVVRRLVAQGEPVRVLSRGNVDADLPGEVELVHGDVRRPADLDNALAGARLVLSAVQGMVGRDVSPASVDRDGNLELVRAAGRAGADVVLMSVTGASFDHPLEMARMKYAAEQALVTGGVPFTVVRAAAFAELWAGIVEQTAGRGQRPLVFGSADRPIWWVGVEDVAEATARRAGHDVPGADRRGGRSRGNDVDRTGVRGQSCAWLARPPTPGPASGAANRRRHGRSGETTGRHHAAGIARDGRVPTR